MSLAFLMLAQTTHCIAGNLYASIIIDDVGTSLERGHAIADIPGAVTVAILPGTDHAVSIANLVNESDKEVMLHMPMQAVTHHRHSPGTLSLHMSRERFLAQARANLDAVPHVRGVNNHMGSLLTRHPGVMGWLMESLAENDDLYFIDSRTTDKSVALQIAAEYFIPGMRRDVFLDPDFSEQTLNRQLERFIETVKTNGTGIAIAHPHPASIDFIRNNLSTLETNNIKLVPVSELIRYRGESNVTCTGAACAGM